VPHFTRRESFASWTWAGWRGLQTINTNDCFQSSTSGLDGVVQLEDMDGTHIGVEEFIARMEVSWDLNLFKPCTHLTGWLITVRVVAPPNQYSGYKVAKPSFVNLASLQFMAASSHESTAFDMAGQSTNIWRAILFLPTSKCNAAHIDAKIRGIWLAPKEESRTG
jgi:hypothetical protein